MNALGRPVGHLSGEQEARLAGAVVVAYDLEVALPDQHRRNATGDRLGRPVRGNSVR